MSPRASWSSACVRKATVTANDDRPTDPRIGLQKMALNVKNDGGWRDPKTTRTDSRLQAVTFFLHEMCRRHDFVLCSSGQ